MVPGGGWQGGKRGEASPRPLDGSTHVSTVAVLAGVKVAMLRPLASWPVPCVNCGKMRRGTVTHLQAGCGKRRSAW